MNTCKWCGGELGRAGLHLSEPWRLWEKDCEVYALRALRDQLRALRRGPNEAMYFDDILALIARAEELAK